MKRKRFLGKLMIYFVCLGGILIYLYYWYTLKKSENDYVSAFYQAKFNCEIVRIRKYQADTSRYILSFMDSVGIEKTIGPVHISNFKSVDEGDSILKKTSSFELTVKGKGGVIKGVVSFD